jgi:hypothetical protein
MHRQQVGLQHLLTLILGIHLLLLQILVYLVQLPLKLLQQLLPVYIPRMVTLTRVNPLHYRPVVITQLPVRQLLVLLILRLRPQGRLERIRRRLVHRFLGYTRHRIHLVTDRVHLQRTRLRRKYQRRKTLL